MNRHVLLRLLMATIRGKIRDGLSPLKRMEAEHLAQLAARRSYRRIRRGRKRTLFSSRLGPGDEGVVTGNRITPWKRDRYPRHCEVRESHGERTT